MSYENPRIAGLRESRKFAVVLFTFIKAVIACGVVYYFEYGLYVVIAYLIYSLESISSFQNLNREEASELFANLDNGVEVQDLKREVEVLKEKLSSCEDRLLDVELDKN
ncbi:hypothetical protein SHAM105786_15935 [Shewanella amazonensis]|uniref:hypothetical protein n=1 Tax=Shewanella amazonensis TaxID=60478 RepID=UPI00059BD773|nr:hypothetical protein [Shewanella amazonensis]